MFVSQITSTLAGLSVPNTARKAHQNPPDDLEDDPHMSEPPSCGSRPDSDRRPNFCSTPELRDPKPRRDSPAHCARGLPAPLGAGSLLGLLRRLAEPQQRGGNQAGRERAPLGRGRGQHIHGDQSQNSGQLLFPVRQKQGFPIHIAPPFLSVKRELKFCRRAGELVFASKLPSRNQQLKVRRQAVRT